MKYLITSLKDDAGSKFIQLDKIILGYEVQGDKKVNMRLNIGKFQISFDI